MQFSNLEHRGLGGIGDEKRNKRYYIHTPTPHNKCNDYALPTNANEK